MKRGAARRYRRRLRRAMRRAVVLLEGTFETPSGRVTIYIPERPAKKGKKKR